MVKQDNSLSRGRGFKSLPITNTGENMNNFIEKKWCQMVQNKK